MAVSFTLTEARRFLWLNGSTQGSSATHEDMIALIRDLVAQLGKYEDMPTKKPKARAK